MMVRKPTMVRTKKATASRQSTVRRYGPGPNPVTAAAAIAAFSSAGSRRTGQTVSFNTPGARSGNPTTGKPTRPNGKQPMAQGGRPSLYDALIQLKAQEDERHLYGADWHNELSLDQPSYGSIFTQIKEANSEAGGSYEFIRKAGDIIGNTLFMTILLGMFLVLPVSMISIGVKHLNDCPKEERIPIYLLVGGSFGFLKVMSLLWKQIRNRRYERLDEIYEPDEDNGDIMMSNSSKFSEALLSIFLFVWFVCGNYWVLGIWKPHFEPVLHEPSNWCDQTVYMFAFIQIMIGYGLMGLILLLMIILFLCHSCTADKS